MASGSNFEKTFNASAVFEQGITSKPDWVKNSTKNDLIKTSSSTSRILLDN
jgi:hypothetical protein